jgi:hypothetical protein
VEKLAEEARAMLLDGVGEAREDGHDLGQVAADRMCREQAGRVAGGGLDDDQPGSAGRPCLVVGDQVVGRQVVVHQARLVRRRDDPVGNRDRPQRERREEGLEHGLTIPCR